MNATLNRNGVTRLLLNGKCLIIIVTKDDALCNMLRQIKLNESVAGDDTGIYGDMWRVTRANYCVLRMVCIDRYDKLKIR